MVAGPEVMHQVVPMLEASFRRFPVKGVDEVVVGVGVSTPPPVDSPSQVDLQVPDLVKTPLETLQFVPKIRSGSFADIGPRRYMEDEHIRIDNLSGHLGSLLLCPSPNAFYGVFDGHGGSDAAAYMKRHAMKLFFEDSEFPEGLQEDEYFSESVANSIRKAFLSADLALADDSVISRSSGTTALTALIFGRQLLVANAGDCRAVLCRKGMAMEMSCDHRPTYEAERQRVTECGGYIEDGYLNGVLSVTRALGDWDMKMPQGSASPLIAEPEFQQTILTEDDEFLIIGCDGIWDVMTSQQAVTLVRKGLRPHFISRVVVRRPAAGHRRAPTSPPAGSRKTAVGSLHPLTHLHVSGFLSPAPRPPPSTSTTVTGRRRSWTKTTGRRRSSTPAPHSPPLFFHSASLRPPARPRRTTPSQFDCEVPCLMC